MEQQLPEQASATLENLWAKARESVFKVAVTQEYNGAQNREAAIAWEQGGFPAAIKSIYDLEQIQGFSAMTRQKREQGIHIMRIQIIDDQQSPPSGPGYLDFLIEIFRRVNVPLGGEDIYVLLRSDCERNGVHLPPTDIAMFDDTTVVSTVYTPGITDIAHRNIFSSDVAADRHIVETTVELKAELGRLLPSAHRLEPVTPDDASLWYETAGAEWLASRR